MYEVTSKSRYLGLLIARGDWCGISQH